MDTNNNSLLFNLALAGLFAATILPFAGIARNHYVAKKMLEKAPRAKLVGMDRGLGLLDIDGKPGAELAVRPNARITKQDFNKEMSGKEWLAKSLLLSPYKEKFSK